MHVGGFQSVGRNEGIDVQTAGFRTACLRIADRGIADLRIKDPIST